MRQSNQKGFTLIELLVVIAIIGVLSTLAVVALNSARQKSRDSKRVADVKQMQTALDLYYADNNGYPAAPEGVSGSCPDGVLGCGNAVALCGASTAPLPARPAGWQTDCGDDGRVYMGLTPSAPLPADETCTNRPDANTAGTNDYVYAQTASGAGYTIDFCVGAVVGGLPAGQLEASEVGIQANPAP